jgi:hypothetical protein
VFYCVGPTEHPTLSLGDVSVALCSLCHLYDRFDDYTYLGS